MRAGSAGSTRSGVSWASEEGGGGGGGGEGLNFRQSGVRKGGRLCRGPPPRYLAAQDGESAAPRPVTTAPSMPSKVAAVRRRVAQERDGFSSRVPRFGGGGAADLVNRTGRVGGEQGEEEATPGPADYLSQGSPASKATFNRKGYGPMLSGARRFGSLFAKRGVPGPGQYEAAGRAEAARRAVTSKRGHAAFCRSYAEEGAVGNGTLPASKQPVPGPGQYGEGRRVVRARRSEPRPFLSSERRFFRGLGEPAAGHAEPGSYDPRLPGEGTGGVRSSFLSKSKRRSFGGATEAPGPGAYHAAERDTIAAAASRAAAAQGSGRLFQVQRRRERGSGTPRTAVTKPAPAPALPADGFEDAAPPPESPRPSAVFRSTTGRTAPSAAAVSAPGPGYYESGTSGASAARHGFNLNPRNLWV